MTTPNKRYETPKAGTPLKDYISKDLTSPKMRIKFSNIITPYYYQNSPKIPRYSISCIIDPIDQDHQKFFAWIQKTEETLKTKSSLLKNDFKKENGDLVHTGLWLIKFQSKEKIPVLSYDVATGNSKALENMTKELDFGGNVRIIFDAVKYSKKDDPSSFGLSLQCTKILLFPEETAPKKQVETPF